MKKIISGLLIFSIGLIGFNSCEKNSDTPPEIPPYESMAIDFSNLTTGTKTATTAEEGTKINFAAAGLTVLFWNVTLTVTLVVPVTAFYQSFQHEAEFLGNATWQWKYDGTGFANTYKARLVGKVRSEDVKWEMYLAKEGIGAHEEFLWFEGTSDLDGNGGQWILYHSYAVQEAVLQIDWEKTGDKIGNIKYTYIRESSNGDPKQLTDGSYLTYGLTDAELDAFYNIEYNQRDRDTLDNLNVNIEWSTTVYNGRIKAAHYFPNDPDSWHCWDSLGFDVVCE